MYEHSYPQERFEKTLAFLDKHLNGAKKVLDLGVPNPMSTLMAQRGLEVINTSGQDLDLDYEFVKDHEDVELVTAFEILEHLLSPLPVLAALPGQKLFVTVPLNLWFASAYKSDTDKWDRHYHEFEDWQFDWLLEKAGWVIKDKQKWIIKHKIKGFRSILRNRTPRYYAVYAERK